MKVLKDNSSNNPTGSGSVDWFVFISSVNGCLRINPESPLGIGPDSELCFALDDAEHAVTFSCTDEALFVTPEVGELMVDGKQILEQISVEPGTTLFLGQLPVFISTSPILEPGRFDTTSPIRVRERLDPRFSADAFEDLTTDDLIADDLTTDDLIADDLTAANVVQLPSRDKAESGIGEILVPAQVSRRASRKMPGKVAAVNVKPKRNGMLWGWGLVILMCVSAAAFSPELRQYVQNKFSSPDTLSTSDTSTASNTSNTSATDEALSETILTQPTAADPAFEKVVVQETLPAVEQVVPEVVPEVVPIVQVTPLPRNLSSEARVVGSTRSVAENPEPNKPFTRSIPDPVTATPKITERVLPVTDPDSEQFANAVVEPTIKPKADSVVEPVSPSGFGRDVQAKLPPIASGANSNSAFEAIEQVNTEHLLVAAQWAMRNGDGPGALILLEAIAEKSPNNAKAVALRDQLRLIMAEVDLK